jgi:hypothetical protein
MGWVVWLDLKLQKRIHRLIEVYGVDNQFYLPHKFDCEICELCDPKKDLRNHRLASILRPTPSVGDPSNGKPEHANAGSSNTGS